MARCGAPADVEALAQVAVLDASLVDRSVVRELLHSRARPRRVALDPYALVAASWMRDIESLSLRGVRDGCVDALARARLPRLHTLDLWHGQLSMESIRRLATSELVHLDGHDLERRYPADALARVLASDPVRNARVLTLVAPAEQYPRLLIDARLGAKHLLAIELDRAPPGVEAALREHFGARLQPGPRVVLADEE